MSYAYRTIYKFCKHFNLKVLKKSVKVYKETIFDSINHD